MVTVHFPTVTAFNTPFVIVQPAPPGEVTVYVMAPVPVPPVNANVIPVPTVPTVDEVNVPCTGMAFENERVMVATSER